MDIKIIKTETDHESALSELDRLMDIDPDEGTPEGDKLEVLALLIEEYEKEQFPIDLPDPIDAIEFFMDQTGLTQRELIPYMGSRSKVSEVLSRKRPLTLSMIRALHKGLAIPAEILLGTKTSDLEVSEEVDWQKFPLKEMAKRGWIEASLKDIKDKAEELVTDFVAPIGGLQASPVLYRRKIHGRASGNKNPYALEAWRAQVTRESLKSSPESYKQELIDRDALRSVVKLSRAQNGPDLARQYLLSLGIIFVYAEHLPGTYLDGATFFGPSGHPIIGMTLRYDRIDYFWFTLLHELSHIALHLRQGEIEFIIDDLEVAANDDIERQADEMAQEALIPSDIWLDSGARNLGTANEALALAEQLKIHPAIVAGRIRREEKNYKKLNKLVGHGEVRRLFE